MLTNQLRPGTWEDVAGQKENIRILKALIKNPEKSPKTLILEGAFGCGKTTCARIFAKELNGIKDPKYDLNNSPFYYEYDSTVIGNVEGIKNLRDAFGAGFGDYWKVVVFDEVHAVSSQAQTALLKILEEVSSKTFFVMCTTHIHKVIPTIRSRSLEMFFGTSIYADSIEHLKVLEEKLNIVIADDVKELMIERCGGHIRNLHMMVDVFMIIGEERFKETIFSSTNLYCDFFTAIKSGDDAEVLKAINTLLVLPSEILKHDFALFHSKCILKFNGFDPNNAKVEKLVKLYGNDVLKITKNFFSEWMRHAFISGEHFQAAMLYFYTLMKNEMNIRSNTNSPENNPISGSAKAR